MAMVLGEISLLPLTWLLSSRYRKLQNDANIVSVPSDIVPTFTAEQVPKPLIMSLCISPIVLLSEKDASYQNQSFNMDLLQVRSDHIHA